MYGSGKDVKSGADLAVQLKPLFGGFTELLFGAGFFAAGMSSALTAPYAAAFAASGALGWKGGQESKKFSATWLSVILIGFIVSVFGFKPIAVIVFAQVANGIVLPIAAIFLLIFLNRKKELARMANRLHQNIISSVMILIVTFLGIWSVVRLFLK